MIQLPVDVVMDVLRHDGETVDVVYSKLDRSWYLHRVRDHAISRQSYSNSTTARAALVRGEVEWVRE